MKNQGFTLIEILVAITILATLVGGVVLTLDPYGQIEKSKNAQRRSDLDQIKVALDQYYSDHECYPKNPTPEDLSAGIPFGNEWRVNNTVYMKRVPQDPLCNEGSGSCYRYRAASENECPQWFVVFAELTGQPTGTVACPLETLEACVPGDYGERTWACVMGGAVNCSDLSGTNIGVGEETVGPTNTPTPTPSVTPTPTPTTAPFYPEEATVYDIISDGTEVVDIYAVAINPLYAEIGFGQTINIYADTDPEINSNITNIKVILYSDTQVREFILSSEPPEEGGHLTSGDPTNGTWSGSWPVLDTYNNVYKYDIIATDDLGNTSVVKLRINN